MSPKSNWKSEVVIASWKSRAARRLPLMTRAYSDAASISRCWYTVVRGGALPAGGGRQAATLARVDGVGGRVLRAPVGHVGEDVKNVSCHRRMSP
jgi:hypothetical protein